MIEPVFYETSIRGFFGNIIYVLEHQMHGRSEKRHEMKTVLAFAVLFVVACAEVGIMASRDEQFSGQNTIVLSGSRPDIVDVIAESGKSMGLSITQFSKETGTVGFGRNPNMAVAVLIGKISMVQMLVTVSEGGKHIYVNTTVAGNFSTGTQDAAAQLFNEFKTKLLQRIGPKIVEDTSTLAKQATARPCMANYSSEGTILSGQTLKTFQEFPNVTKAVTVERMTVYLVSEGYLLLNTNTDMGIISASQSVSGGRVITVNVVVKEVPSGSTRVDVVVQIPAGLAVASSPQLELCKIIEACAAEPS